MIQTIQYSSLRRLSSSLALNSGGSVEFHWTAFSERKRQATGWITSHAPNPYPTTATSSTSDATLGAATTGAISDRIQNAADWTARPGREWYGVIQRASEDFQGFLQAWLYFGVVQLFFRRPVAIADLTKAPADSNNGELYLDSTQLLALVDDWLGDLDAFSKSDYMALSEELAEARFVHEELRAASRSEHQSTSGQAVVFADYLHR